MFLIDTHCHIHNLNYKKEHKNIDEVLEKSKKKNVKIILAISTSLSDFKKLEKMTKNKKNILLSCGMHPIYIHEKKDIENLKKNAKNPNIVAIGETGLDFFRSQNTKKNQIKLFQQHINIAKENKKPLIIHNRQANKKIIEILEKENAKDCSGILHSFNADIETARKLLNMGFYISFSGLITFKNTYNLQSIIKYIPINRLLIETDSPYLSPEPYRGRENQPAFLYDIALFLSKKINKTLEEVTEITQKNFFNLFKINFKKEDFV